MNLNKAFILGNITRNPETRALPSGKPVASFGVATNRFYTDNTGVKKQEAEFHNVVAFGKLADICSRYLQKGSLILVEGRLKTSSWQNAAGAKQFKTEIIADNIQMAPRSMGGGTANAPREPRSEEIPVIEESYNPPLSEEPVPTEDISGPMPEIGQQEDEIDIKDIPF
ncbi:MAG: single-stranded DNA-binding protein [Candidatus Staskawiczbacteria bacterium]|jgi:single-strand DNA-binding protein